MDAFDFLENFPTLYLCRQMSEKQGWFKNEVKGEWKGASAAGFPKGLIKNLPQWGIRVTKPCRCFIQLEQPTLAGSTYEGKNKISFMVSKEQGGKIDKVERTKVVGTIPMSGGSGPDSQQMAIIQNLLEFDDSVSYPYTFTVLAGSC